MAYGSDTPDQNQIVTEDGTFDSVDEVTDNPMTRERDEDVNDISNQLTTSLSDYYNGPEHADHSPNFINKMQAMRTMYLRTRNFADHNPLSLVVDPNNVLASTFLLLEAIPAEVGDDLGSCNADPENPGPRQSANFCPSRGAGWS